MMDLDGILLNVVVLMSKVCGDTVTKDGADFVIIFLLRFGVGSSVFFWHDHWFQGSPLGDLFPSLLCFLRIEMLLLHMIVKKWMIVLFSLLLSFVMLLWMGQSKPNENALQDSSTDQVTWDLNSKEVFTVNSYYLKLLSYSSFASLSFIGVVSLEDYLEDLSSLEVFLFCLWFSPSLGSLA